MTRWLTNLDKRIIVSFLIGAVLVNLILYALAGWVYSPEIFSAFGTVVQAIIAAVAVAALLFPGKFEKLKNIQTLKNEYQFEFSKTLRQLEQYLGFQLAELEMHINEIPKKREFNEKLEFSDRAVSCLLDNTPINPDYEKASEYFDRLERYGFSFQKDLKLIYNSHRALIDSSNRIEKRIRASGLYDLDINDLEFDGRKAALTELSDRLLEKHTLVKNLLRQVTNAQKN